MFKCYFGNYIVVFLIRRYFFEELFFFVKYVDFCWFENFVFGENEEIVVEILYVDFCVLDVLSFVDQNYSFGLVCYFDDLFDWIDCFECI